MGQEKEHRLLTEEGQLAAAERDGRTCHYCGAVIPYGVEPGPNGEGPECIAALRDDD